MTVLIIEDEQHAAEKLQNLLHALDPDIKIAGTLSTIVESINWLNNNRDPDLILMDIQLDDGICFEIFEAVNVTVPIIFTTAYDSYAVRAFKVNSVDYLLKPINEESLGQAIEKYRTLFENRPAREEKFERLYSEFMKSFKNRFFVKIGEKYHSISVKEIEVFFIRDRATFFRTPDQRTYDVDYSLDQVQQKVDPDRFFRINRNYLINIDAIKEILRYSAHRLKVSLKHFESENLIVSREKVRDFKKWLDR